jgi:hypothetical protein
VSTLSKYTKPSAFGTVYVFDIRGLELTKSIIFILVMMHIIDTITISSLHTDGLSLIQAVIFRVYYPISVDEVGDADTNS